MIIKFQHFYDMDGGASGGGEVGGNTSQVVSTTGDTTTTPATSTFSDNNTSNSSGEGQTTTASTPNATNTATANVNTSSTNSDNSGDIIAGGLRLSTDPKTGRKIVLPVSSSPKPQQDNKQEPALVLGQPNPNALPTNITVPPTAPNAQGLTTQVGTQPEAYKADELLVAMNLGSVDEKRIPDKFKPQYEAYKIKQAQQTIATMQADVQNNNTSGNKSAQEVEQRERNKQFYTKVDSMAKELAMKELGITQDDIEAAEYSDDEDLVSRVSNYKSAVEYNRNKIFNDVQAENLRVQQQQETQKAEHTAIYSDVKTFIDKAKQEEPNFNAIDVMMLSRYKGMPYDKAKDIEPTLVALQNGTLTRQQAILLQEYYNDTRKAFYAQASNVGTVPTQVARPPVVERPGNRAKVQQKPDFSKLRNMNYRDKQRFIGALFQK